MSILNELIAKVTALTSTVNQLITNSKAIQELPAQETLNPDSLIHVSKDSVSKKITVQQIINAAISNQNDQIISIGTITLSGNNLTISDISAKINNVIQSISLPTIINIPFCASGLKRIDLLVYNTSNEITRIAGTETAGAIVIAPTLPINSLLITQISVTDSVISEPQPPILSNNFLQKEYEKAQLVNMSGIGVVIPLNIKGRNNIILNGALTGVTGFSLANLDANPASAEYPHEGKDYYIQNKTGHAVTLKNFDTTVDIPFLSKDGNDIVVPNNGIVFFKNSSNVLQEIFRSYDSFDLSLKADLVNGKVKADQLPSYVDDVLEFINLAALPTTGEAGKIYVTLDFNKQYRWGGTGYIEISASTAVWGSIGGTIANQTDLIALLNAKQNTITANANRLLRYTPSGIIDSILRDNGSSVSIGTDTPSATFDVIGNGKFSTGLTIGGILSATNIGNTTSTNNGLISLETSGIKLIRNVNDTNSAFEVSNANSSASGPIQTWKNDIGEVLRVAKNGNLIFGNVNYGAMISMRIAQNEVIDIRESNGFNSVFKIYGNTVKIGLGAGRLSDNNSNVNFGYTAGYNNTGLYNVFIGANAGYNNSTGERNIFIGNNAGFNNTTGGDSIFIGDNTQPQSNNQTNQIVIGKNASGIGSNTVIIGNDSILKTALKGQIAIGTTSPETSALLEVKSSSKGFLPPRMTEFDRDNIQSPVKGLIIYNTSAETLDLYTNANGWRQLIY